MGKEVAFDIPPEPVEDDSALLEEEMEVDEVEQDSGKASEILELVSTDANEFKSQVSKLDGKLEPMKHISC